ncbi:cell adhesion molecule 3 [Willisornis vidua]|uniref:Cell adhesion molecule 3 n=1 Tax=Willisornis vidua TaxID=1566151 RepID=A0ABQ9DPQ8_9PASS|nr:cell adhesion molecule 3 [Willisornis vidua]
MEQQSLRESQPTTSDETVVAGGTVVLKCQVEDPDDSSLQWSNPAQQTLYFGEKRALRDNRIQLERSTPNELTISISDVVLADEGEYTCSIFTMPVRTAKALVTVLGIPQKPQIFGHEQPIDEEKVARLTCRSSGSKPAAALRWRLGNRELKDMGVEVVEDPNGKTFTVSSRVEFRVTKEENGAEVTCSVDHESLQNSERSTTEKLQVHYASPVPSTSSTYHAMIGGVVAVIVFLLLSLLIVLGHYLIRHKGTYLTHEAKGSDDAPDADTAIINAEGGQGGADDKKEYFI